MDNYPYINKTEKALTSDIIFDTIMVQKLERQSMMNYEVILKKPAKKFFDSCDAATKKKIIKALDRLSRFEGDIRKIAGKENLFRYKINHYRIIFEWEKGSIKIIVIEINTRTNIKY